MGYFMTGKSKLKLIIDILMTVALILLMAYNLIGASLHEYIGVAMFILFLIHHYLNFSWSRNIFKGRYSQFRIAQLVLAALILICMLSQMGSGIILSRHVFRALQIKAGKSQARTIHMLAGYWGLVLMSVHLGLHWNMIRRMTFKNMQIKPQVEKIINLVPLLIAVYGVFAFFKRGIPGYLFMRTRFAFFDFEEPLVLFFLDYIAVMILFVWAGHMLGKALKK